jgi:hypothetical protein
MCFLAGAERGRVGCLGAERTPPRAPPPAPRARAEPGGERGGELQARPDDGEELGAGGAPAGEEGGAPV